MKKVYSSSKPSARRSGSKPYAAKSRSPQAKDKPSMEDAGERINRFLARCGLCSRREADRWLAAGRVSINGEVLTAVGTKVQRGDKVSVDGKVVKSHQPSVYLVYHKPAGLMCSRSDDRERPLIYDKLDVPANVQSVGRLDMDTEGLLLLTDDGDVANALTRPQAGLQREYRIRVQGHPSLEQLEQLRRGGIAMGDGDHSDPWEVIVDAETGGHTWMTVTIKRGRWREIRRTLDALKLPVRRLIRTRFGPLRLEDMPKNAYRSLRTQDIAKLQAYVKK